MILITKSLRNFTGIVLIERDFVAIEVSRRTKSWASDHYFLGDEVYFELLDLTVFVTEIYRRVDNDEMREFLTETANLNVKSSE